MDQQKKKIMRFTTSFFYMLMCSCSLQLTAQQLTTEPAPEQKVVFIIVDGIANDMLKNTETPQLDAIAQDGGYTEAYVGGEKEGYSKTPTISAVGYNSLLTGVWANKHNVWGNSIKDPNYNYPTIFRLFKDVYPNKSTAIFSTWLDNRTKLIGTGLPQTQHVEVDYAFDGFELDTIRFPHDPMRDYIKNIDALVATEASAYIKSNAPYLSWVYLEYSDDMGHGYGDSPQLTQAIKYEDSLIGKIYDAVKYREQNHNEDWLIVVTTDHGRSAHDGKGHGGQSDRERATWIVTNSKATNSYFKNETPAIVDILPTLTSFLDIPVADATRAEWDGVSLIDPVDLTHPTATLKGDQLVITWENLTNPNTEVTLLSSKTNAFKTAGKDAYSKLGTTTTGAESYEISLEKSDQAPVKILIQTRHTTRNVWVTQ